MISNKTRSLKLGVLLLGLIGTFTHHQPPRTFHCKMQRFWVFPKQIPMIRDFKSLPSSGFHPLLAMLLIKIAMKKPRESISKMLFEMLRWYSFSMRNIIPNKTRSLKFGVLRLGPIGTFTHHHSQAKSIMKRVRTPPFVDDKTYYKVPLVVRIIYPPWLYRSAIAIWTII